jgi:membrane fusion protein (multidrug efflux system)
MRIIVFILLLLVMILPVNGLSAQGDTKGQGPLPLVKVAEVSLQDADRPEKFIGHVESIVSIDLQARVDGYLEKVNFKEGSFVQQGQLLYVIEQLPYTARVALAKAKLTQAEADLFKARTRFKRLLSAQPESVPQTDLDDAKAAKDLALGRVDEAKANLELARIDLNYTTIEAPIEGRIGKSFYKQGDLISPSAGPLAEIVSMDPIRVVFSVNEKQIGILQQGFSKTTGQKDKNLPKVKISFPDKRQFAQQGTIEFIDNKMDPETGTIAVWARFDNPNHHLIPGEYVNVFLQSATPNMQPAVSQVAVQRDRKGDFVYVVGQDNQVEKRRIQTGASLGDAFAVISGLRKGEKVMVQGIQKVSPGMRVKTKTAEQEDS